MVWQALLVALVLQLACTRGGSLKAPPLPSSFTKAEQDAADAAWAALEHARCAEWAGHFVWNASALKFPSCLAPPKEGSEMPSRCIPNLIHQTWQTKQPPPRWQPLVESCRRTNPSFVYLIWTDADAREYITKHHSWFLPTFDDYKFPIQRADAIRYFILRDFGGIYLDMDYECHTPFEKILGTFGAPIGLVAPHQNEEPTDCGTFSNSMMISATGLRFWDALVQQLPRVWSERKGMWYEHKMVLSSTGPRMLQNFLRAHPNLSKSVCAMLKPKFTRCSQCDPQCLCGDCVTLHRYSGSWRNLSGHVTHAWDCHSATVVASAALAIVGVILLAKCRRRKGRR